MGWSYFHRDPGQKTHDVLAKELLGDSGQYGEFMKSRVVGDVFYAAHKLGPVHGAEEGRVTGLVVLLGRASGYFNFGYKSMGEESGPYECECPAAILDLLSPTDDENSLEWRAACHKNAAAKAAKPRIKPGDTVKFSNEIEFSNGDKLDTFLYNGGNEFRVIGYGRYKITGWRKRDYALA